MQLIEVDRHAGAQEAVLAQVLLDFVDVAVVVHQPEQPAEDRRQPVRQPVYGAEVEHAQPPVRQQPEVARMRIGVQQTGSGGPGEQEPDQQHARVRCAAPAYPRR